MSRIWVILAFHLCCLNMVMAQKSSEKQPALVVGICIDQLRWDYLERFKSDFGKGGFNRLRAEGFSFENTRINYAFTATAAGHASVYTGTIPAMHGIVGNDWWDSRAMKSRNAVQDSNYNTVGSGTAEGMMSPRQLLSTTIGDELRLSDAFRSRVFSVALKDRSAVLPGGRSCNASYWLDEIAGKWVSSSYYMKELPPWVNQVNQSLRPDSLLALRWTLSKPSDEYRRSSPDSVSWERIMPGDATNHFPHSFLGESKAAYLPLCYSPQGNKMTFEFCRNLVDNERLGRNGVTDMLCLSLSSLDFVGHETGPDAVEIEDMMIKLDQQLTDFLNFLDKRLGKGNYLLFLTADHGVAHVPGYLKEQGMATGILNFRSLKKNLNDSSKKYFGIELVQAVQNYQVYLNRTALQQAGIHMDSATDHLLSWLRAYDDVAQVFPLRKLEEQTMPTAIKDLFANGYYPARSGDIQIVLNPQIQYSKWEGADHGSIYNYDRHIPLLWFGFRIPKGRSFRESTITDIAPTVAAILGIQMPNAAVGKVLEEVVK